MTIAQFLLLFNIIVLPDVTIAPAHFMMVAQKIRGVYEGSLTVTSNVRTIKENKAVGGHYLSKHLCGYAIDIRLWGLSKEDITTLKTVGDDAAYNVVIEADHIHIETDKKGFFLGGECTLDDIAQWN